MKEDPVNGVHWLLARSDVEAAVALMHEYSINPDYMRYVERYWPQFFDPTAYRKIYKESGEIEARVAGVFEAIPRTHRYNVVAQAFEQLGKPKKVLDFGCSRAFHAIHLHNLYGAEFTCLDIDETSINVAKTTIQVMARSPQAMTAKVATDCSEFTDGQFDAVMCLETLEHLNDYRVILEQFEQVVKPGGWIIVTLPHGPVEFTMWCEHPERNREHLRELNIQDCFEVWGAKPGFVLNFYGSGMNRYAGMCEGNLIVAYRADREPCGEVNMDRKILGALACVGPPLPDPDGIIASLAATA